uniref:Phage major capsid protein E n=1 Tax=Candidatus Kentrum sp. LFY TaxID=2126342 RepID=A0A450W6W6_9GAMM|nr:MAG: Phage major capsid protein E [Candidatus Kentron sp. LFY]
MPINLFETRTMLAALEEMKPVRTFLLDSFFVNTRTFGTEAVDIDIVKGKRKMAPFVSPYSQGKVMRRDGYKTETFKPPYIKPKRPTRAQDFLTRTPGEAVYAGSLTPQQRAARQLGKDLMELREGIVRREEWMAAQALTTGKVIAVGEGINAEVDFNMAMTHKITLSGTSLWTDASADPIKNLRTWKRMIAQDCGVTADRLIIGAQVVDPLYERLKGKLDTRRIDLGFIKPQELANGVTYIGYLNDPGVDIFTYDEWYLGDDDQEHPMVPEETIILGSTRARTLRAYGAIQDVSAIESGMVEAQYYPKSWVENDPSARFLMIQSAPLVIPTQIDGFMFARVV